jgi:hypothetical protein
MPRVKRVKLPNGCWIEPGDRVRVPRDHIWAPYVVANADRLGWELGRDHSPGSEVLVWPRVVQGEEHQAPASCCDGYGQVHHGEGALSYVTLCRNRECLERGIAAWTDPQHETPASGEERGS